MSWSCSRRGGIVSPATSTAGSKLTINVPGIETQEALVVYMFCVVQETCIAGRPSIFRNDNNV